MGENAENYDDFLRALKPANRPDNTKGLNEFGLGMKYAAVWISNEWELISTAVGEEVERHTVFNFDKVVNKNLMELPTKETKTDISTHYTIVKLKKLEKKHVHGFKWKTCEEKIASIYRNFIRSDNKFFSLWQEDSIDLIVDHKPLQWEEFGFLKALPFGSNQEPIPFSTEQEWKYKFDWLPIPMKEDILVDQEIISKTTPVEVSGFIGILPSMMRGKNGFTLFRRGRMVEGIHNREYPDDISGSQTRSHR